MQPKIKKVEHHAHFHHSFIGERNKESGCVSVIHTRILWKKFLRKAFARQNKHRFMQNKPLLA